MSSEADDGEKPRMKLVLRLSSELVTAFASGMQLTGLADAAGCGARCKFIYRGAVSGRAVMCPREAAADPTRAGVVCSPVLPGASGPAISWTPFRNKNLVGFLAPLCCSHTPFLSLVLPIVNWVLVL